MRAPGGDGAGGLKGACPGWGRGWWTEGRVPRVGTGLVDLRVRALGGDGATELRLFSDQSPSRAVPAEAPQLGSLGHGFCPEVTPAPPRHCRPRSRVLVSALLSSRLGVFSWSIRFQVLDQDWLFRDRWQELCTSSTR